MAGVNQVKYYVFGQSGGCNYGDHRVDFEEFDTLDGDTEYIQDAKRNDYDYSWRVIKGLTMARGDEFGAEVFDSEFGVSL